MSRTVVSLFLCILILIAFAVFGGGLCVFRRITGFPCPGCGMTRAVLSVLRGDLRAAFSYHPLVFTLPVILFLLLRTMFPRLFPFSGSRRYQRTETVVCCVLTVLFLAVWLYRMANGWRG